MTEKQIQQLKELGCNFCGYCNNRFEENEEILVLPCNDN